MATTKLDLTKECKTYYTVKKTPEVVEFDEAQFVTIEGKGAQVLHIGPYSTEPESLLKKRSIGP